MFMSKIGVSQTCTANISYQKATGFLQLKGSVEKGDNRFWWLQKVKGQWSIFVVKQAIMAEVQQLNLCTVEI